MRKRFFLSGLMVAIILAMTLPATALANKPDSPPGKPDFSIHIYADGVAWGSKLTTYLPAPNDHNMQSYDKLFDDGGSTVPVAEAAPGNPEYNGGRWSVYSITWNVAPYQLYSYQEVMDAEAAGDITTTKLDVYFQCPLLPVKE